MYRMDHFNGKILRLVTTLYYAFWRSFMLLSAYVSILGLFEPPVRTLRATLPV